MPTRPTPELDAAAYEAWQRLGGEAVLGSKRDAALEIGIAYATFCSRVKRHEARINQDPGIQSAMAAVNTGMVPQLAWLKTKDENGNGVSVLLKPEREDEKPLQDLVREAIEEAAQDIQISLPKRPEVTGEYLLVVDLADVHFLKLCVKTETGYSYSRDVARHRVIEGTRALLQSAGRDRVGRVLFVLGNDILHVDNASKTTTSGTPQDTEGSIFQGYKDAYAALTDAINLCAEVAIVDLIHCMSNHDWVLGWSLSQAIAARFKDDPRVNASDYNLSEAHRKYYRFGNNLLSLDHGDGVKEEKLLALIVKEAREHVADCQHIYAYRHHVHHKIRQRRGVDVFISEKDHIAMTAVHTGAPWCEGAHLAIEYVRSPSPPDGWHDRNGYINRQGVECFLHHPQEGQKHRFTEWF